MKVAVMTLGCKVNKYESDSLIERLNSLGYRTTDRLETADVYIINTCAVTAEAEKKSRQMIARCRKFNRNGKIFVCGCASQNNSRQFEDRDVEVIVGTANKQKIVDYLENLTKNRQNYAKNSVFLEDLPQIYQNDGFAFQNRARAYIKIQDGCDNFCSYCIIPYLRGRSRSRELASIAQEAKSLDDSIKEIVLTGINVTDYKINGQRGLLTLLQELDKLGKRLRLSSIEEGIIDEEFIKGLAALKNFCPHFHLSLQSGSDSVLKRMNRHYTSQQFLTSISQIKKYFPLAGITTDVIVGFPDESDEEFSETCNFVQRAEFSQLHIFKYSQRKGTASAKIYKDLPFEIKQARMEMLEKLNEKLKSDFIKKNSSGQVLVEEMGGGYYVGYTKNYIRCYIESEEDLIGQIIDVSLGERFNDGVKATKISN